MSSGRSLGVRCGKIRCFNILTPGPTQMIFRKKDRYTYQMILRYDASQRRFHSSSMEFVVSLFIAVQPCTLHASKSVVAVALCLWMVEAGGGSTTAKQTRVFCGSRQSETIIIKSQVDILSHQAQALTRERQKLEAEAANRKSHQSTMSKAVRNLVRKARSVVAQIHEIEMGESQRAK